MESARNQTIYGNNDYYHNKLSTVSTIGTRTKRKWENLTEEQNHFDAFCVGVEQSNLNAHRSKNIKISDETFDEGDLKPKAKPSVRDRVKDSENNIAKSGQSTDDSKDNAEQDDKKLPASPKSVAEAEPAAKKPALPPYNPLWPTYLMQLMNIATNGDAWEPVMDRIRTHAAEIAVAGPVGGQNGFHAACVRFPPVHVLQAMLEACPEAAKKPNECLETPLHLASTSASEEVQTLLIRAAPETARMVDKYGDTPLHLAIRQGATYSLVELLVAASPEAISVENKRGVTPFWLLPRSYLNAETLQDIYSVSIGTDDIYYDEVEMEEEGDYQNDWELLVLFLRFSYYTWDEAVLRQSASSNASPDSSQFEWMVHAAAATPSCPRETLRFLCRLFPNAAAQRDENGFVPLHYACFASIVEEPQEWDENEDGFRETIEAADTRPIHVYDQVAPESITLSEGADNEFFQRQIYDNQEEDREDDSKQSKESVLEILLNANPASASCVDLQGRLPLAHALVTGKPWKLLRRIISSSPHSLELRDVVTGLYMFQLAAKHARDLDTVYNIVRTLPNSVSSLYVKQNDNL